MNIGEEDKIVLKGLVASLIILAGFYLGMFVWLVYDTAHLLQTAAETPVRNIFYIFLNMGMIIEGYGKGRNIPFLIIIFYICLRWVFAI